MEEHVEALPDTNRDSYDDAQSSTSTIASTIYAYEAERGRSSRSYETGKYVLPNDEEDNDRLDIAYHAWRLMLSEKMFFARLPEKPTTIMDIGTGSGMWALDVGYIYPETKVIATDVHPLQPRFVPTNVKFEVCDCTETPWAYPPNSADLIHARMMNGFGIRDWIEFYKESFRVLKPGASVESHEFDFIALSDDDTLAADSATLKWCALFCQSAIIGGDLQLRLQPATLQAAMEEAGFIDVTIREFKMPVGLWPADARLRETGKFALGGILHGMRNISVMMLTSHLGWMAADVEMLMDQVREELKSISIHSYWPCFIVYGQKPADAL